MNESVKTDICLVKKHIKRFVIYAAVFLLLAAVIVFAGSFH